jgi:O-antigen ligase
MALLINRMRGFGDGMLALSDEKLVFAGVALALMLVTLISTNSRMGVAAFGVAAIFFLLVLAMKRASAGLWLSIGITIGVLVLASVAFSLYGATLLERLGSVERDADVRFALYEQVWEMIRARPWTGHGPDSFEVAFPAYHHLPVSPDLLWNKAHNTYLTNWAETGLIIGSIPILLGLWVFLRLLYTVYKRQRRYIFPLLGASVILQGAIHSTVDFSLEIQANMYMLLAIVALGYAEAVQEKKRGSRNV